jgi:enoyl-CoA hydratase
MTSGSSKVLVSKVGPVTTVMINRPERRNAIDAETATLLFDAFTTFEADPEASVAVLCGEGEHFCGGYDLKSLSTEGMDYQPDGQGPLGPTRMALSKPVIAAVEGYAVAGGLELTLWCDLRVASDTAIFGVYCRRWGVPLIDGGTVRLPRLIGHSRALDMILTGRGVRAEEALSFGLANRVTPAGTARQVAEPLAAEIARFPQTCLRADRASSYRQWGSSLEEALRFEGVQGEKPLREEAIAGATRFAAGLGRSGDFSKI